MKRSKAIGAMEELGIPAKLQRLIIITIKKTKCNVRTKEGKSEDVFVKTGLRQEDPLSTILFNVVLEKTIRSNKFNRNGDVMHEITR